MKSKSSRESVTDEREKKRSKISALRECKQGKEPTNKVPVQFPVKSGEATGGLEEDLLPVAKKGLGALMEALSDGQGGRPSQQEDPQTQSLREEQEHLKQENALLSIRLNIQKLMAEDTSQIPLVRKSKGYRTQKKTPDP